MNSSEIDGKAANDLGDQLLRVTSPEGWLYAGLPKFRRIFGRDSIISAMQMLPVDSEIAKNTLLKLASLQGKTFNLNTGEEKGKIPHEHFDDSSEGLEEHFRRVPWLKDGRTNYFSVDSTPLFVNLAYQYYRETGDTGTMETIIQPVRDAVSWIINDGMFNDTLAYYKARQGMGLQSQSWRDGIGSILELAKDPVSVIGVQGYLMEALFSAMRLSEKWEMPFSNDFLSAMRKRIADAVENFFYIDETDYFALAIDGDGVAVKNVTSDPGHLLHSGMLSPGSNSKIISRLFEKDMITDYGIRSMSSDDPQFDDRAYHRGSIWPHDNWLIAQGMKRLGHMNEYNEIKETMLRAYEELGSIPEYYSVDKNGTLIPVPKLRVKPCDPQAWSTCALLNFIGSDPVADHEKGE